MASSMTLLRSASFSRRNPALVPQVSDHARPRKTLMSAMRQAASAAVARKREALDH